MAGNTAIRGQHPGSDRRIEIAVALGCPADAICSLVSRVVEPVDSVVRSTGELSNGAGKLTTGSTTATTAFAGLPPTLQSMRDVLGRAKAATRDLRGAVDSFAPQVRELSGYLQDIDGGFAAARREGSTCPAVRCRTRSIGRR
ncbi:MAG TPA: hypothetical protein VKG83_10295 [Mycobacterium sp.]|nr:hypothetical protein [Mycobacterium sp.]